MVSEERTAVKGPLWKKWALSRQELDVFKEGILQWSYQGEKTENEL